MDVVIRVPREEDWEPLCHVDGRNFGFSYTEQERAERRSIIDLDRFRIACDGDEIVGIAGSYAFDVALPGGTAVPMSGVTWVSVSSTHRRRGLLHRLMAAVHDDAEARGEPVATLTASESSIYERFGYGAASTSRHLSIERRRLRWRDDLAPASGAVRFVDAATAAGVVPALWDRAWRGRPGEVHRSPAWQGFLLGVRGRPEDDASEAFHLQHADGYATYRVAERWDRGHATHELRLLELVAATPAAHADLWRTLLGTDLVETITTRAVPADDPLPYLVDAPRQIRTTAVTDGVWVKVLDPAVAFSARSYATADRLVVEVVDGASPGRRWAMDGGPDGGSCRAVRSRPDLELSAAALGALLYGGVRPSALAAGRRLSARTGDALRRADLFFPWSVAPHCQTAY